MCDWSAAELRSWSQVCIWLFGFSKMAEAFKEGKDPHTMLAATLRRVSYEEALELKKAGDLPERKVAKAGNFGFLGGMGASTFVDYCIASGVSITLQEAQDIRSAFAATWPESERYFKWITNTVLAERNGIATQFVSQRQRGGLGFCEACNTFFQGLTADYAKTALWAAWKESLLGVRWFNKDIKSPMKGVRIWLLLHDELIVEGPEDTSAEWGDRLRNLMVEVASMYTPDVPQIAEVALSRIWSKKAEEIRDSKGNLLPWSPKEER
jgi:DNA polymerase I-like protein with 3'-5' exonuclease and polymerase domains